MNVTGSGSLIKNLEANTVRLSRTKRRVPEWRDFPLRPGEVFEFAAKRSDTISISEDRDARPSIQRSEQLTKRARSGQSILINTKGAPGLQAAGIRVPRSRVKIAFIISAARRRAKAQAAGPSHPLLENGSYQRKKEATTFKLKKRQNSRLLSFSDTRAANAHADDRTILDIKNTNDSFTGTGRVNSNFPDHDLMPERPDELSKPRVQSRRSVDRTACVAMGTALLATIFVFGFIGHEISTDEKQGDLQVQKLAYHHLVEKRLRKINPGGLFTDLDNGGYLMAESA